MGHVDHLPVDGDDARLRVVSRTAAMIAFAACNLLRPWVRRSRLITGTCAGWIAILAAKPVPARITALGGRARSISREIGIDRVDRVDFRRARPDQGFERTGEAVGIGIMPVRVAVALPSPDRRRDPRRPRRSRSGDGWRRENRPARRCLARGLGGDRHDLRLAVFKRIFRGLAHGDHSRQDVPHRPPPQALWAGRCRQGLISITASRSAAVWPDARSLTRTNRGAGALRLARFAQETLRHLPGGLPWPRTRRESSRLTIKGVGTAAEPLLQLAGAVARYEQIGAHRPHTLPLAHEGLAAALGHERAVLLVGCGG